MMMMRMRKRGILTLRVATMSYTMFTVQQSNFAVM